MQLKKHNFKTPPERKPKWLRKGIALLTAVATLATGGIIASTAYAAGGGGNEQAGPGGTPSKERDVWWRYKDQALSNPSDPTSGSLGSAATDAPVYAAFNEAGIKVDVQGPTKITAARTQAYNECKDGFHARHPGEGDGDCRVVAVGAMLGDGGYHGNSWQESIASHWVSYWDQYIKPWQYHYAGAVAYDVNTPFTDDPSRSVQSIMNQRVCNNANYCPADNKAVIPELSIVVIVLDKYHPVPPIQKFTPTISTSAPHVIQEGQSITDNVTVGVKQGDQWPKDEHGNNVSITAKGYYFTGSKDKILTGIPHSGGIDSDADIQHYINQIKSAGGTQLGGEVTKTFNSPGQQTAALDPQKAPANTWGTWVWFITKDSSQHLNDGVVSDFGQRVESALYPSYPNIWSEVAEPYAEKGADVRDVLHINGLPKDFGKYQGEPDMGIHPDNTQFTMKVFWSGSGKENYEDDKKFAPSKEAEPGEAGGDSLDDNYKLLGEYTFDMREAMKKTSNFNGALDIPLFGSGGIQDVKGQHPTIQAGKSGYYTFVMHYDGDNTRVAFKSGVGNGHTPYNDNFESTLVKPGTMPNIALNTNASKSEVNPGEQFNDVATITGTGGSDKGVVDDGSYVEFNAYGPTEGTFSPNLPDLLTNDNRKVMLTNTQVEDLLKGNAVDVQSTNVSTTGSGKVYWRATLKDSKGTTLATHALGLKNETVTVKSHSITTKASSQVAYVGENVSDTIQIQGKLQAGDKAHVEAYDANNNKIDAFTEDINLDNNVAASDWGKTIEVKSTPHRMAADYGKVQYKVSLMRGDTVLATHDTGIATEVTDTTTPSLSTKVSEETVTAGQKFSDVANISGYVEPGAYVLFNAYNPVSGKPDTNAGKLLTDSKVEINDAQSKKSADGSTVGIKSTEISTEDPGTVYWHAALYDKYGNLLTEHDLGVAGENTLVIPPTITTEVSKGEVQPDEKFHDTAVLGGALSKDWYVEFTAYQSQPGAWNESGAQVLHTNQYHITDADVANSAKGKEVKVSSEDTSTKTAGNVYYRAEIKNAQGRVLAAHQMGISSETVVVQGPEITTQESTNGNGTQPDEKFHDTATIKASNSGVLSEDWYVEFTAYKPVQGGADQVNDQTGKLLDRQKVSLKGALSSDKKAATVRSQDISTPDSGNVYWKAELKAADGTDGTLLATHDLGIADETTMIAPGGIVTSHAQTMGAVGEQLYDEITVYDETPAAESADGKDHKGDGSGNTDGFGHVPAGSYVTVELYRQSGSDEGDGQKSNLVASKNFTVDTTKFKAIKDGQTDSRPGYYTFKATDPSFKVQYAGQYWWKSTLYTPTGRILDAHKYGEVGDKHEVGYESSERTNVQKYSTTVSKKWLSVDDDEYANGKNDGKDPEGGKTLQVYDVLHQTGYEKPNDTYRKGDTGQTVDGTKYTFEIWKRDGANNNQMVKTLTTNDLPKLAEVTDNQADGDIKRGADDLDSFQNVKSETVTLDKSYTPSKYYFRVKISVPTASTTGIGTDQTNRGYDVVWYGSTAGNYTTDTDQDAGFGAQANNGLTYNETAYGYSEDEAFDVLKMKTRTTENLWVTPQQDKITDDIELWGNIPAKSQYEVEVWRLADGQNTDTQGATATTKVATTGRQDVPSKAIGAHLDGVIFRSVQMDNPGVGSYQFRLKFYSPEQPHKDGAGLGTGGDTTMNPATGVITEEWMKAAGGSTEKGYNSGDYWKQANNKQKGNGDGYSDRWMMFDGKQTETEQFEVVNLTTDVTKVTDPNNYQSVGNEHYVDVTKGKEVNDYLKIDGHMLEGYRIKYELWRKDNTNHKITDEYPYTEDKGDQRVFSTPVHTLKAGQASDQTETYKLYQPGDYYWTYDFTKPENAPHHLAGDTNEENQNNDDTQVFLPANSKHVYSNRNIIAERFHAIRITTAAYRWAGKGEKIKDTLRIEGWLDGNSDVVFNLMDKGADAEKATPAASTKSVKVKDLARKGDNQDFTCEDGKKFDADAYEQNLCSPELVVPDSKDYYWSEVVTLPNNQQVFHRGEADEPSESLRSVDSITDTSTEYMKGTLLSDHSRLDNVSYDSAIRNYAEGKFQTDGNSLDNQVHTEKFTNGELRSTWRLYKQAAGDDASKDTLVAVLNGKDAPAEVTKGMPSADNAVQLNEGQVDANSAKWDSSNAELGDYYWVNVIWNNTDKQVIQTGKARDPRESFAIIEAKSESQAERGAKQTLQDTVTISGPVKEGTMVSWKLYKRALQTSEDKDKADGGVNNGATDDATSGITADNNTADAQKYEDTLVTEYSDPAHGAVLITAEEAATAKKDGKVTVKSPETEPMDVGEYHWVFSLTAPAKNIDGKRVKDEATGEDKYIGTFKGDGTVKKPAKDSDGKYTTAHLADNDPSTPEIDSFFEDLANEPHETTQVIDAHTKAQKYAYINKEFYDRIEFEGHVVKGTQVEWDLYKQADDAKTNTEAEDKSDAEGADKSDDEGKADESSNEDKSADVDTSKDTKVLTTTRVVLEDGQSYADSPKVKVPDVGTYYWVHRVYDPVEHYVPSEEEVVPQKDKDAKENPVEKVIDGAKDAVKKALGSDEDESDTTEAAILVHTKPILTGKPRVDTETTWVFHIYTKADPLQEAGSVMRDTAYIEGPVQDGMQVYFQLFQQDKGDDPMQDKLVGSTGFVTLKKGQNVLVSPGIKSPETPANFYWRESLYPPSGEEPPCPPDDHGNPPCEDNGSDKPCNPCENKHCTTTTKPENGGSTKPTCDKDAKDTDGDGKPDTNKDGKGCTPPDEENCDKDGGDCTPPCGKTSKDTNGDGVPDTTEDGKSCLPKCEKGAKDTNGDGIPDTNKGGSSCVVDDDNDGVNDHCTKKPCEGTCKPPLNVEKPRTPNESTHTIKVRTEAQQTTARSGDPVQDKAIITGDMIDGYEVMFEAWKQSDNGGEDKLAYTTKAVSVSAGSKEVLSPKWQVNETGTYYWREKLVKTSDKTPITYGAPRVKEETFLVKEKLAMTGSDAIFLAGIAAALIVVSAGASYASRKKKK